MEKLIAVFDLDGTLADNSHREHWVQSKPKNWTAFYTTVHLDGVHQDVAELARILHMHEYTIVICSGRPDYDVKTQLDIRDISQNWLIDHAIPYDMLLMRNAGDYRPDDIIKVELLGTIRELYGVKPTIWFDDRDRVVQAIRNQGIRVLQVRKGDF